MDLSSAITLVMNSPTTSEQLSQRNGFAEQEQQFSSDLSVLVPPVNSEAMACCCVSDRQRSPEMSDKAEKCPLSGDDHYYEPISPVTDKQQLILAPRSPTIRPISSRNTLNSKPQLLPKPNLPVKLSNGTQPQTFPQSQSNPQLSEERVIQPIPPLPVKQNVQKMTSPPPVPPKPKLLSPLTSQTCAEWSNSSPVQSPVTTEAANGPCNFTTSPVKPPIATKPNIPPKPNLLQRSREDGSACSSQTSIGTVGVKPTRPPRSRQNSLRSLVSTGPETDNVFESNFSRSGREVRLLPGLQCRKSASLGKLEALKCSLEITSFQSTSMSNLQFMNKMQYATGPPSAPPRRRKTLDDDSAKLIPVPVYAKVDLSKKTKKAPEIEEKTSVLKKLEDIPSAKEIIKEIQAAVNKCDVPRRNVCSRSSSRSVVSQSLEVIVEVSPIVTDSSTDYEITLPKQSLSSVSTPDAVTVSENFTNQLWKYSANNTIVTASKSNVFEKPAGPDSQSGSDSDIDTNLLQIEHTVAAINSVVCSLHEDRKLDFKPTKDDEEHVVEAYNTIIRTDVETENSCARDVTTPNSIARLVFSGSVVSPTEEPSLVKPRHSVRKTKIKMKEFQSVLEDTLKFHCSVPVAVNFTSDSSPTTTTGIALAPSGKEVSPAPSVKSTSSSSSDFSMRRSVYEDDLSTGALADVDTSDVTRQSSFEEGYRSNGEEDTANTREGLVSRRQRGSVFSSVGKTQRRNAVRRKTKPSNSSTESEVDNNTEERQEKRPSSVNKYQPSRPAPLPPSGPEGMSSSSNISLEVNGVDKVPSEDILQGLTVSSPESSTVMVVDLERAISHGSQVVFPISPLADSDTLSLRSATDSTQLSVTGEDSTVNASDSESEDHLPITEDFIAESIADPKRRKVYYIAKEIASSERVFVDCLALLTRDFAAYIKAAAIENKAVIIPEPELERILNYLPQLYDLNVDLLHDLEARVQNWLQDQRLADVIVKKGPFLKLYSTYIQNFRTQSAYLEEACQKYPLFAAALKDFEKLPRCQNLALQSFFLKPIQRIPQYRLLLADYKKNLELDSPDYNDTVVALQVVSEVAEHANNSMKLGDYVNMLFRLQSRLGSYAIIQPGRQLIREGELLKLSRKTLHPRYFILLNDCLLYTSYVGAPALTSSLKVHSELPLEGMRVCIPLGAAPDYQHEFNVISNTRSFTLSASSDELRDAWLAALTQAIDDHNSRQSSFQSAKTRIKEPKLGQQAPIWIHDNRVTMCQLCTAEFTVTFRRHHCRACGKVICSSCSCRRAPLEYLRFQRVRVCDECYAQLHNTESYTDASFGPDDPDYDDLGDLDSPRRPSSEDVAREPASLAGLKAQTRRKEKRMIPERLIVSANDAGSQMSGFLWKRGRRGGWKKAWFVLKDKVLYTYKASEDVVALESSPVLGYIIADEVPPKLCDGLDPKLVFELLHTSSQVSLVFRAENPALATKWVEAMSEAVVLS